jgi:hypothetical protein
VVSFEHQRSVCANTAARTQGLQAMIAANPTRIQLIEATPFAKAYPRPNKLISIKQHMNSNKQYMISSSSAVYSNTAARTQGLQAMIAANVTRILEEDELSTLVDDAHEPIARILGGSRCAKELERPTKEP